MYARDTSGTSIHQSALLDEEKILFMLDLHKGFSVFDDVPCMLHLQLNAKS